MKKCRVGAVISAAALTCTLVTLSPTQVAAEPSPHGLDQIAKSAAVKAGNKNKARFDRIVKLLPKDWEERRDSAYERLGIERSPAQEILIGKLTKAAESGAKDIDPTDYECAPTKLDAFVDDILEPVDPTNLLFLLLLGALDVPTYDALIYGTPKDPDYALPTAYAPKLTTTFGYLKRFWDVRLNDVGLLAMHGEMITDVDRTARTVEFLYGVGPSDAVDIATDIKDIVESDPGLDNGSNPLFTLNAYAFSAEGETDPVISRIKDKVVFGDGILAAVKASGLNAVGPRAILAHEMAHHVQYEADLFESDLTGPEATRRTELMADAFGTYFLTHKKGEGMAPNGILQAGQAFYDVGDCSFDSPGHHGTPNQRRAASAWGAAVVAYSNNPNKVLPTLRLDAKFEKTLPLLVKPDAPTTVKGYKSLVTR